MLYSLVQIKKLAKNRKARFKCSKSKPFKRWKIKKGLIFKSKRSSIYFLINKQISVRSLRREFFDSFSRNDLTPFENYFFFWLLRVPKFLVLRIEPLIVILSVIGSRANAKTGCLNFERGMRLAVFSLWLVTSCLSAGRLRSSNQVCLFRLRFFQSDQPGLSRFFPQLERIFCKDFLLMRTRRPKRSVSVPARFRPDDPSGNGFFFEKCYLSVYLIDILLMLITVSFRFFYHEVSFQE